MSGNLRARVARLERSQSDGVLRDTLAQCGISMPARGDFGVMLAALDDDTLDLLIAKLEARLPPAECERRRAWIAGLRDEELEAVIAEGRP